MIPKIDNSKLKEMERYDRQGVSGNTIYTGKYNDQEVIIKQLESNDPLKIFRFKQELSVLLLKIPGTVKLLAYGDNFLVLEKLYPLPDKMNGFLLQDIAFRVLTTAKKLYDVGFNWNATESALALDKDNHVVLIDFNDDNDKRKMFIGGDYGDQDGYNYIKFISGLCTKNGLNPNIVLSDVMKIFIVGEYQELKNVHEPIFYHPLRDALKMETDPNDPNCGKLVQANRTCWDRAELIEDAIKMLSGKALDLGCNVGWFSFFLHSKGLKTVGVDFDEKKIDFCNMLSSYYNNVNCKFITAEINKEFIDKQQEYDVILALSILHLLWTQQNYTREKWIDLFKAICRKTKKHFIFEVSTEVFGMLEVASYEELADWAREAGDFKTAEKIGKSLEGRTLILCSK